jgi:short-subunit dehydrogenase
MAPYNVSKAAVISLTETLQGELAPHGIAVSALCPTFFHTNLMESFRSPEARQRQLAESMFRTASMTAEQVAQAGLLGLERGEVIVIPQRDGQALQQARRWAPDLYRWALRMQQKNDLPGKIMRWLGGGGPGGGPNGDSHRP